MTFFKKFFNFENVKSKNEYSNYLDLDKFEKDIDTNSELKDKSKRFIKIAIFSNESQIQELKQEIYNKNILIVDISPIKGDERLRKRILSELKEVIIDVNGDIVGMKENLILITPTGIEIDRNKMGGDY